MTDNTNIPASSGSPATVATDEIGGVHYQKIKLVFGPDDTATRTDGTSGFPVAMSGTWTVGLSAGSAAVGKLAANSGVDIGDVDVTTLGGQSPAYGTGSSGSTTLRVAVASDQLGSLGQTAMSSSVPVVLANNQSYPTGMSPREFSVAFATLTRPANTTAYAAGDSISDNGSSGLVTALVSGNVSDTNDDPVTITEVLLHTTDTGFAGKKIRAYLYNSNPTSSSGVGAGDNAAFSNKKAGYIGSVSGTVETGFSDGGVARLVPTYANTNTDPAGAFIVATPVSGAKTFYIQYQYDNSNSGTATPSANSTTFIGTLKGFQGRAS